MGSLKEWFDLTLVIISAQHEYYKSAYAVPVHKNMLVREWHCEGHSSWATYPNSDLLCPWGTGGWLPTTGAQIGPTTAGTHTVAGKWFSAHGKQKPVEIPAGLQAQRKACLSLGSLNLGLQELSSENSHILNHVISQERLLHHLWEVIDFTCPGTGMGQMLPISHHIFLHHAQGTYTSCPWILHWPSNWLEVPSKLK